MPLAAVRLLVVLLLCGHAAFAGAQVAPRLLQKRSGGLVANYNMGTLATPAFERKMRSGLTQRLLYRVLLKENPGDRTAAVSLRFCAVTFDLWDESWSVECTTRAGTRRVTASRYSQLLRHVAALVDLPFPDGVAISPARRYHLEVQVQLNPISRKLLEKVKLWLRQSEKGSQFSGYMGSMLSLFVDKSVGGTDLTLNLRSSSVPGREVLAP